MDNAEPLNDAQAEAALLALGSQLEWALTNAGEHRGNPTSRAALPGLYFIQAHERVTQFDCYHRSDLYHVAFAAADLVRAKAACERHHATGKWE